MDANTRNYEDMNKAVNDLIEKVNIGIDNMNISEIKELFESAEHVISEWSHLSNDIDEWIYNIENQEE